MGKLLLCLPMILLLTACTTGGGEAEELALTIRGDYLAMSGCSAQAEVTADYGQRVYQFQLYLDRDGEDITLTLTAPETVAGITARLTGEENLLEYDGLILETGPLDDRGLTPVSALPVLLEEARSGFITACTLEEDLLRVDCGDPEGAPGAGRVTTLWFHPDTHALARGEITLDGRRAITCELTNFTLEKGSP